MKAEYPRTSWGPAKRLGPSGPRSLPSQRESVRLVIVENGTHAREALVRPEDGDQTVVVAQDRGEPWSVLALRVAEHVATIERSSRTIAPAVIVVAHAHEPEAVAARGLIARNLLSHMRGGGGAELMLASSDSDSMARSELLSLVEALLEEYADSKPSLRVQFRGDAPGADK